MRRLFVLVGLAAAFLLACAQTAPVPATPSGGGAQPTATRPAAGGVAQPTAGNPAEQGKQLVTAKGCIACHAIKEVPGAVGTIGPALDGVGDPGKRPKIVDGLLDNNTDNLKKWLANPPGIKPGTVMPNLFLTPQEIDSLVAFLQTLK